MSAVDAGGSGKGVAAPDSAMLQKTLCVCVRVCVFVCDDSVSLTEHRLGYGSHYWY